MRTFRLGAVALCFVLPAMGIDTATGQETESLTPTFRPRRDRSAVEDTDALRERLKSMVDSRGRINPLADYVGPAPLKKSQSDSFRDKTNSDADDEATQSPSLTAEETARLKKSPPAPLASEFAPVALLPAPKMTFVNKASASGDGIDDGFRPVQLASTFSQPSNPWPTQSSYRPNGNTAAASIPLNALVPSANVTPTIGTPSIATPVIVSRYGDVLPAGYSIPLSTYPVTYSSYFSPQDPIANTPPTLGNGIPSMPLGGYNNNGIGNPNIPGNGLPTQPNYPPVTSVPIGPRDPGLPQYQTSAPYVNGAPFVSPRPNQFDGNCMVSPSVYRQAIGNCPPAGRPGVPATGYAAPAGSPFVYAPPAYMPSQAPISPNNGGFYPLFGFGQQLSNAQLGRGIVGQPTAYVPGQPIRNFLRYISP